MAAIRKIFIVLTLLLTTHVQAQEYITMWYGINHAGTTNESYTSDDKRFRFLNVGVDYTNRLAEKWDWTAGASINSKGVYYKANYIQVEGNASYCLVGGSVAKLTVFTGPYMGVKINGNEGDWDGGKMKYNTFSCGWQAGLGADISYLSLKVGYEHAFTNICDSHKTYQWFARVGLKLELLKKM